MSFRRPVPALLLAVLSATSAFAGCSHEERATFPDADRTHVVAATTAATTATATGGVVVAAPKPEAAAPLAEVTTDTSQTTVLADKDAEVLVRVRLKGLPLKNAKQPPINLALVVDTSGSMVGPEIEKEKEAVATLVDHMRDGDTLSIVTFGSQAKVIVPAAKLDAKTRAAAKEAIKAMTAQGTTDLAGGLAAGLNQAQQLRSPDGINRIVLIGDGVPNDATPIPGFVASAKQLGIPITTLGLGADFDETLMSKVARDSGGTFHFVDSAARVATVFDQEIARMQRVVARNSWVQITPGPGVEIKEVIGVAVSPMAGRAVSFSLGALAEGQTRDTMLRVKVSGHKEGRTVELLDVAAHLTPAVAGAEVLVADFESIKTSKEPGAVTEGRVAEVEHQGARALVADGIVRAIASARAGDLKTARTLIDKAIKLAETEGKRFDDADLSAKAKEAQNVKKTLASLVPPPAPRFDALGAAIPEAPSMRAPMAKPAEAMAVRKAHGAAMDELQGL